MTVDELVLEQLRRQRRTGAFCDLRLAIGGRTLWTHSAVVCALSPFVRAEFETAPTKQIELGGRISVDCFDCFEKLVDGVYGGRSAVDGAHAVHLHEYCRLFGFAEPLLDAIERIVDNYERARFEIEISVPLKRETPESADETCNETRSKRYGCVGCEFECRTVADMLNHARIANHDETVCSLCRNELDSVDALRTHLALHEHAKPFFCVYCAARFRTRSSLAQHVPKHMTDKPYACPYCRKAFKRRDGLHCHVMTHAKDRRHLCDECGFGTSHARILRAHKLSHGGKLFECEFPGCTHASTRVDNLKQHAQTHAERKRFACELCGDAFSHRKSLKRHSSLHGEPDSEYACPSCTFTSRRLDNLHAHVCRRHSVTSVELDSAISIAATASIVSVNEYTETDLSKRVYS